MTRARIAGGTAALLLCALLVALGLVAARLLRNLDVNADDDASPAIPRSPATSAEAQEGFLYGRVTTGSGAAYEGRLRFGGDEEAFWGDYFNGFKEENRWAADVPPERLTESRPVTVLGVEITQRKRQLNLGRPFMARFGDIRRVEPGGRDLLVTLKNGTGFVLNRFDADDFADGVRVWDDQHGVVDLGERRIRAIEFLPTADLETAPDRLHGTVWTPQGSFTGFVQWDRQSSVGSDELQGRTADGELSLRFDAIRSIARDSADSALVTLRDGGEFILSGSRAVGRGNRGVYVDDLRYGRVLVSWDAFERLDFSTAAGSGPAYDEFPPGRPLSGTVVTRTGRRLTGRLVFDLDESETTETLDAPRSGVDYTILFGLVASIALPDQEACGDGRHARVTLRSGESLELECAGDLGPTNAGMLIYVDAGESAEYVARDEVEQIDLEAILVADMPTRARSADGQWISWREHIIDDVAIGGVPIRGGDGLQMGDLDGDGYLDIVSVHESDTEYGNVGQGHVRLAFGGPDPATWHLATLAEGDEAAAAEDVALDDFDGDGDLDVVAACELAHLIYFENPGTGTEKAATALRGGDWQRVIPAATKDRGSYIRVFTADLDGDGRPEVVAPNKGAQNPDRRTTEKHAISWFDTTADPASGEWIEHEIVRVIWPINSQTVDLDGDGDVDIVGGSTGEGRIFWFENRSEGDIELIEHPIRIEGTTTTADTPRPPNAPRTGALLNGFNMAFVDLSGDGRLDLATVEFGGVLVWLEQPADPADTWQLRPIGRLTPDNLVGFAFADIDGDGDLDAMSGAYSRSGRAEDREVELDTPLGRLAWFDNPGDIDGEWTRHDISRRKRGMFDSFVAHDLDGDGDIDFAGTRGNSADFDGVYWLEQVRTAKPVAAFDQARETESEQMPLP